MTTINDDRVLDARDMAEEMEQAKEPDLTRLQVLNDVRRLLDWLEQHEEVPLPYDFSGGFMLSSINTREEVTDLAREFKECEKDFVDDSFYLRKRFGLASLYAFTARKEICRRVVIGTEEVPERVQPAYTRELVEWHCDEPLLNGKEQQ